MQRRSLFLPSLLLALTFAGGRAPALAAAPAQLAQLALPGDPAFTKAARDVIDVVFTIDPSVAANAGLLEDAVRVPTYGPAAVKRLVQRLDRDLRELRRMPWRSWSVDRQIDFRWIYAQAETARRVLADERIFVHRPAAWLEPLANDLIAFASYAPEDKLRLGRLWARVPAMVSEMRQVSVQVTRRDQETARRLLGALTEMARQAPVPQAREAGAALAAYDAELAKLKPAREFAVIGAADYAWRLKRALLLDVSPEALRGAAEAELARVETELAELKPKLAKPAAANVAQKRRAADLSRDSLLGLYDAIEVSLRQATLDAGFVTIPEGVGPIRARETPDAMVPLTGDGGSMNPPPPLLDTTVGWWNVEKFHADWPTEERVDKVVTAENWKRNWMGPYAAHEGFPGHHLQLAIARLHENPIRSILPDAVMNEGWGLYAEEELWRHGGMGDSLEARSAILRSYRYRISRVVYDVNIETGAWDLQRGADFKDRAEPGKGEIDEELMRAIQWPTQLISYYTGKRQILELREALKRKLGKEYSDRAFHDAFLAEGSIPVALIRAKLLGEPVPGI